MGREWGVPFPLEERSGEGVAVPHIQKFVLVLSLEMRILVYSPALSRAQLLLHYNARPDLEYACLVSVVWNPA